MRVKIIMAAVREIYFLCLREKKIITSRIILIFFTGISLSDNSSLKIHEKLQFFKETIRNNAFSI